jgi:hypothetical protein
VLASFERKRGIRWQTALTNATGGAAVCHELGAVRRTRGLPKLMRAEQK